MIKINEIHFNRQALLIGLITTLSSIASIALLTMYLNAAEHGMDFTDEGYYINWIHNPTAFKGSVSFFGKVYHPIYKLVGENIRNLRVFNILTLFITSFWLSIEAQNYSHNSTSPPSNNIFSSLNAITIASLSLSQLYIMTPNYNSLALTGCITTSIFFLRITKTRRHSSIEKILNIGGLSISLAIIGLAKATSLALIIACLLIYMVLSRFKNGLGLGVAIGISIASISPFFIHFNIDGMSIFNERVTEGLAMMSMLESSHGGNAIIDSIVTLLTKEPPSKILLITALFGTLCIFRATTPGKTNIRTAFGILGLSSIYFIFKMQFSYANEDMASAATLLAAISVGTLIEFTLTNQRREITQKGKTRSIGNDRIQSKYLAFLMLATMPISYAIGTSSNLWGKASHALIFYALCSIILVCEPQLRQNTKSKLAIISTIFFIIVLPSILGNIENPYRQNSPLTSQSAPTQINHKSILLLDEERGNAIKQLQHSINEESNKNISIIDLTGHFPGLIYAIGAKPMGASWLIGGYPGSNRLAAYKLKKERQDSINKSWVLIEKDGRRSLDHKILQEISDNKKSLKTMKKVVEVDIPVYNKKYRKTTLQLYKNIENAPHMMPELSG